MYGSKRCDTRRRRHGKLHGGHHGGSYSGDGGYIKRQYWRAERRYWRRLAARHLACGPGEHDIWVSLGSLDGWRSEVDWKGW